MTVAAAAAAPDATREESTKKRREKEVKFCTQITLRKKKESETGESHSTAVFAEEFVTIYLLENLINQKTARKPVSQFHVIRYLVRSVALACT